MIGDRLKQARELSGWTQEELASRVGVKQAAIAMIERDALAPSDELLTAISDTTGFPREFFDLPVDIDFPLGSLVYRKFARMLAEHRRRSHRLAQQAFELAEFFLSRMKPIPLSLPRGLNNEDPVTAARIVRNALGIDPVAPIKNLIHRLEKAGVRVFVLPDEIPDLDAFSVWVDGRALIVVNPGKPGDRQNFSVAHELGHLVLHQPLLSGQDGIEREANAFAGEFLLPEEAMRLELISPVTLSLLAELKTRWYVSMQALLYRAKELHIISERQNKYLRMQLAKKDWVEQEPVAIQAEKPRGLRKMAEVTYGAQPSYRRIAADARRPPFLVSRLIEAQASRDETSQAGRVIDFRSERVS